MPKKPKSKAGAHFKQPHQPAHRITTPPAAPSHAASTPAAPAPAQGPTLYELPVPAALVAANPSWIDGSRRHRAKRADGVELPVPPGTTVKAVTAGRIIQVRTPKATAADPDPTTTVTLAGTDGATYTYTGLVQPAVRRGHKVAVGHRLAAAGAHGIGFVITVPDVRHRVNAREALEAWSLDATVDVRALPVSPSPTPQPDGVTKGTSHVLVVSDPAAGQTAKDLQKHLRARRVKVSTLSVHNGSTSRVRAAQIAKAAILEPARPATRRHRAKPAVRVNLVIIALGSNNTEQAKRLTQMLPADQKILWVAPPASTKPAAPTVESGLKGRLTDTVAVTAAAEARAKLPTYRSIVAAHPNLRVETLPRELSTLTTNRLTSTTSSWNKVGSSVIASLAATYATTAYRLPLTNPKVATVLAYAEAQIGKPYVWAGAGPYSFDCSGLVMRAFERVGIDFVHNAYAQYEATKAERVRADDLQPGDLVFFGPTEAGIHHVGIYVGGGRMLDAPQTGQDVQIESMAGFGFYAATDPLGTANSTLAVATTSGLSQDQAFAQDLITAKWGASQWVYLDELWNRESGWNPTATNPTSGAFGIPQALPARKMSTAGADWATDPFTQIMWGIGYIEGRYGSPQAAWAHETRFGWY
ncbi:MAG TPA: NlpC/P60 family protein [Acidimicrobiales bacterium]|nr:NlpC/P60 family protein [Acidimicrobiales bacterium]